MTQKWGWLSQVTHRKVRGDWKVTGIPCLCHLWPFVWVTWAWTHQSLLGHLSCFEVLGSLAGVTRHKTRSVMMFLSLPSPFSGWWKWCSWRTVVLLEWEPPFFLSSSVSGVWGAKPLDLISRKYIVIFAIFLRNPHCFRQGTSAVLEERTHWVLRQTRRLESSSKNSVSSLWHTHTHVLRWEELTEFAPQNSGRAKKLTEFGVGSPTLRVSWPWSKC